MQSMATVSKLFLAQNPTFVWTTFIPPAPLFRCSPTGTLVPNLVLALSQWVDMMMMMMMMMMMVLHCCNQRLILTSWPSPPVGRHNWCIGTHPPMFDQKHFTILGHHLPYHSSYRSSLHTWQTRLQPWVDSIKWSEFIPPFKFLNE